LRILITGGAGFVGSNLALAARSRLAGAEVVCMDNLHRRGSEFNLPRLKHAGVDFYCGDVRNALEFPAGPFDFLVECSAEPSVLAGRESSPDYLFETNLGGAYRCFEKAREWKSRVLFVSTSRVYPVASLEAHPFREEPTRFVWGDEGTPGITREGVSEEVAMKGARSLYGFTKLAAEELIEEYRAGFGLKALINRCGVIAGPWQFGKVDQGIASHWVQSHLFGRRLSYIGYGGAGKQVRDFLHIDDLCDLLLEQIQEFDRWEGWVGNVSGGLKNTASLQELTVLCREITGSRVEIDSIAETRPWDLRLFIGDCAKLFARTSWRPSRDVRQIVSDIAKWAGERKKDLAQLV
jgi:CDP-paratose 2-epimerase